MALKHNALVAQEANQFEATLKAASIPNALHDGLWDIWVDNGPRAYGLVARFKDNGQRPATADESEAAFKAKHGLTDADMTMLREKVRYKAGPGMQTVELPAGLASALTAARAAAGDEAVAALLTRAAPTPAHGAKLADDEKAATAIKSIAQQTMPGLYKK